MRRLFRRLRPFGKKRGERRTGSARLGSMGMLLFFAGMFFLGWCFLAVVFTNALAEWHANRGFEETTCRVLAKRIGERRVGGHVAYRPEVQISYRVNDLPYVHWTYDLTFAYNPDRSDSERALAGFQVGEQRSCWYDPRNPSRVVVERRYTVYLWLMGLLPLAFICVGFAGLVYNYLQARASAERRSVLAARASANVRTKRRLIEKEFPAIPREEWLTDSPGTSLTYRLPVSAHGLWALGAVLVGGLVWNAMVSVFITLGLRSVLDGRPEWLLLGLGLVFAAVGAWLVWVATRMLRQVLSIGRTLVEISDHPLLPGEEYTILVSQFGRAALERLRVLLLCTEHATYQQGTNTRSESRRVHEEELLLRSNLAIDPGVPLELLQTFRVPDWAMHSFRSAHNEVAWRLVVEGAVAGWPEFQRVFPLIVHPPRKEAV